MSRHSGLLPLLLSEPAFGDPSSVEIATNGDSGARPRLAGPVESEPFIRDMVSNELHEMLCYFRPIGSFFQCLVTRVTGRQCPPEGVPASVEPLKGIRRSNCRVTNDARSRFTLAAKPRLIGLLVSSSRLAASAIRSKEHERLFQEHQNRIDR